MTAIDSGFTSRFEDAFVYANRIHGGQKRKKTTIPYISHLMSVAALVMEDGGDEDVLGADGVGDEAVGADFEADGVRVEVGVVAGTGRLGVGADDVAGRQQVGEVAGVGIAAETAGQARRQRCQQQKAHSVSRPRHRPASPTRPSKADPGYRNRAEDI